VKYSFHAAAEAELGQAIDYYNACRPNLGWEFAKEVQATIQSIIAYPEAWTPLSQRARRCLVRRFPYGVVYERRGDLIRIVAVMQLNRRPEYWRDRTAQP
jgi:plasmid stabilization system protein ParE